jgi:hypothetical protein
MPNPVQSGTNPGRSWYRLSIHFDTEAMEALKTLTERLTESYGTKVSMSQALRIAVIDTERETRINEENHDEPKK